MKHDSILILITNQVIQSVISCLIKGRILILSKELKVHRKPSVIVPNNLSSAALDPKLLQTPG